MKARAYILTFLAYTVMHSLRTGYSFSKTYFKLEYDFSKTFLAVLDSSIYFAMGAGFFFRYFFLNSKDIIFSFFLTGAAFIAAFTLFPLLSVAGVLDGGNAQWISIVLMILFGFFQMNCWPVSFLVVTEYFTNEEDGGLIGFWTCAGSIGNILGYIFPALLILSLHFSWQVPLLVLAAVLLASTLSVHLFVSRPNQPKQEGYLELEGSEQEEATFSKLLSTFAEIFSALETSLLLINACLFKAIIYTFLLWLPILVDSVGEKSDSAYISVIYNLSTVCGASLLGKLYEDSSSGSLYSSLQFINPLMALVQIGGIVALSQMQTYSFTAYALIIVVEGFISGGIFNILTGNEMIKVAGSSSVKVDLYTTATFAASSFSVGVAQLMVGGFLMGSGSKGAEPELDT